MPIGSVLKFAMVETHRIGRYRRYKVRSNPVRLARAGQGCLAAEPHLQIDLRPVRCS
jgi:hypothetical protein